MPKRQREEGGADAADGVQQRAHKEPHQENRAAGQAATITMRQILRNILSNRAHQNGAHSGEVFSLLYSYLAFDPAHKKPVKADATRVLRASKEFKTFKKQGGTYWRLNRAALAGNPKGEDGGSYALGDYWAGTGSNAVCWPRQGAVTMRQILRVYLGKHTEVGPKNLTCRLWSLLGTDGAQGDAVKADALRVLAECEEFVLETKTIADGDIRSYWRLNKELLQGEPKGIDGGSYTPIA